MRDINRIEPIIKKIEIYWKQNPDLRFGQVIYILADELNTEDIFFPEEDKWEKALDDLIERRHK